MRSAHDQRGAWPSAGRPASQPARLALNRPAWPARQRKLSASPPRRAPDRGRHLGGSRKSRGGPTSTRRPPSRPVDVRSQPGAGQRARAHGRVHRGQAADRLEVPFSVTGSNIRAARAATQNRRAQRALTCWPGWRKNGRHTGPARRGQ